MVRLFYFALQLSVSPCIAVGLLVLIKPCQLPYLGSLFNCSNFNYVQHLGLAVVEGSAFLVAAMSGLYYSFYILLPAIAFICQGSAQLDRRTGSVIQSKLRKYAELAVSEKIVHSCVGHRILPAMVSVAPICQILSFGAIINFRADMNGLLLMLVYAIAVVSVLINWIFFTVASKAYIESRKWLADMKNIAKGKFSRRLYKACKPIKVSFLNNFVDAFTPLVIQELCISQVVNFTMTFKKV